MSREVNRVDYGDTPKGHVLLITRVSQDDSGEAEIRSYMVRQGGHTLAETADKPVAEALAKALARA